jgi:hypothetical protein
MENWNSVPALWSEFGVERVVTAYRLQPRFADVSHEESDRGIE